MITHDDVKINVTSHGFLDLWSVRGFPQYAYPNKAVAMLAARELVPEAAQHQGLDTLVYWTPYRRDE